VYLVVDEKTLNDLQPNATLPSLPTSIESHTQQSPDPRPLSQTAEGSRASLRSSQQPDVESIKAFNASARSFHGMLETRLPELQNVITSMDILLARVRERRPDHPALLPCHKTIERIRDSATNIEATRTLLSSLSPLVTDCERSLSPRCAEVSKAAEELEGLLAKQNEINAEALILQVECRSTLTKQS
jgi:ABC-type transporter Mla subunit MlaD